MSEPTATPEPTPALQSARLLLEPLRVEHADEMAGVLADPVLYTFTGGEPATLEALRGRYRRMVAGPGDPAEQWHNWVLRTRPGTSPDGSAEGDAGGAAVGTVQATVTDGGRTAELAWVTGTDWQRKGYAREAAATVAAALRQAGATRLLAHIHPDHAASEAVARRVGLTPTGRFDDEGEQLWEESLGGSAG